MSVSLSPTQRIFSLPWLYMGVSLLWILVAVQSCLTLCDPWVTAHQVASHHLPEFAQTHVHWVSDAIQPSHSLLPPSLALNLSQHQSFPMSWLFTSGGQSIRTSASALDLPMNIHGWFPLGLAGLIFLLVFWVIIYNTMSHFEVDNWLGCNINHNHLVISPQSP